MGVRPNGDSTKRLVWEVVHKNFGRAATIAGILNCMLGASLARQQHEDEDAFDMLILASFGIGVIFILASCVCKLWACIKMNRMQQDEIAMTQLSQAERGTPRTKTEQDA